MSSHPNARPVGTVFGITLALSWTLTTLSVGLAMWSDRHASAFRLVTWVSLWTFTVLAPTSSAMAIHYSIRENHGQAIGDPSIARLAGLRSLLLLSANMAFLSACALVFGR